MAAVLPDTALRLALDYAGVAVFAATGALAAARKGHDIVTFAFFAAVTGIGGGTLRDLLLGAPVFWVGDAGYVGVSIVAAGAVWALGERAARWRSLLWLDAVGLAAYSVLGAAKAAAWGAPPLVTIALGVLSATFGGVVRDVLAGEASVLLRREIYVTAAVAGAGAFVLLRLVGLGEAAAGILAALAAFGLRAGALTRGWSLPGYAGAAEPTRPVAVPMAEPEPVLPPPPPAIPPEAVAIAEPEGMTAPTASLEPAPGAPPKPAPRRRKAVSVDETSALPPETPAPPKSPRPRRPRAPKPPAEA